MHICEGRAKTHESFYMIEVHRHRFARHARKVQYLSRNVNIGERFAEDLISMYIVFFPDQYLHHKQIYVSGSIFHSLSLSISTIFVYASSQIPKP